MQMVTKKKHFNEKDRIFFGDGYRLAQTAIESGLSNGTLYTAIDSLYAAIDGLNDSIIALAKRQNRSVACFNGCHWCCHQAVFANSYELHYLSEKINSKFSEKELGELAERTKAKSAKTSVLTEEEVLKFKSPCPLLINGSCSAYEARPMACRIYLSTQLESCIEFYKHPENEDNFPALIDFPLRAGQMLNEGFSAALKEIGIETAEFRLEMGLNILLNENTHIR
jgi:Fe-S-cluster containining protein